MYRYFLTKFVYQNNQLTKLMKNLTMKFNESKNEAKGLSILQKIGICLLVMTIIVYYVLSIQFLAS